MFANLTRSAPLEYRLHERLDGIDGEAVRAFFLSFRQRGPRLTWDGLWNTVLEAIVTLLPWLRKHLTPGEIAALEEWTRLITGNDLTMAEGCNILSGIGRLPALRSAIETATRSPFPSHGEAVLLCLTKVCRLSRSSGHSLSFTLDAAREALHLEKPRIDPALLNHPVVHSLWGRTTNSRPQLNRPTLADVWPGKAKPGNRKPNKRQ